MYFSVDMPIFFCIIGINITVHYNELYFLLQQKSDHKTNHIRGGEEKGPG